MKEAPTSGRAGCRTSWPPSPTAASACSGRARSSPASAPGSRTWRCPGSSTPASATRSTWACAASPRRCRCSPSCSSAGRWPTASTAGSSCSRRSCSRWRWRVLLGVLYLTGHLGIVAIVLIAFATGLMQSQSAPTYQAVITSLVPRERIANAVALNSLQFNLSRAIGPVVAGLLLAHAGAGWCFAANALSFVGVILALRTIEFPPPVAGPRESLGESLQAGLRHVRGDAAAALGDPARRRRELPGLPAHHLPAGDRGRRAQDRRLRLQPAADQRRHRRDRGRGRHRPARPRRGPRPAHAPRLRRLRPRDGRRRALALAVAVDGPPRRLGLRPHDRLLDPQLARAGDGARTRCAAACSRSSASPSAAAGPSAAWSRAASCARRARPR